MNGVAGVLTWLVILFPLAASVIAFRSQPRSARPFAIVAAALVFAFALTLLLVSRRSLEPMATVAFRVDVTNATPLLALAAVSLIAVAASARRESTPFGLGSLLLTEGLALSLLSARDFGVVVVAWALLPVPAVLLLVRERRSRGVRAFYRMTLLSGFPLAALLLLLGVTGFSLGAGSTWKTELGIAAIGWSALVGSGIVPFHVLLTTVLEETPAPVAAVLFAAQPSACLVTRFRLGERGAPSSAFAILALASALVLALLSLVQRDLRRVVSLVAAGQATTTVALLMLALPHGSGRMLYWASSGATIGGLLLCVAAIERRTGTTSIRELGGLARHAPKLATLTFAFAFASEGFPISLTFLADEQLTHHLAEAAPLLAVGFVFVGLVQSIALLRALMGALLGPGRGVGPVPDLTSRERVSLVLMLGALLCAGAAAFSGLLPI